MMAGTLGKNLSNAMESLLTSSSGGKYCHQAVFGIPPGQNSSSLIFCPMELKFCTGINFEALISNSSQNIRYKYVLREKKAIFSLKLKLLPKRSLTKVLSWQQPRLPSTNDALDNYTKSQKVSSAY